MATSQHARESSKHRRWLWTGLIFIAVVTLFAGLSMETAAQLENHDGFCAACHTEPETTFVQRTQKQPVDLASAHAAKGVACIACHSQSGVRGRVHTIMTLGVRDLAHYVSGHYAQPATLTHPMSDANCLQCHQDILHNRSFDNHFHFLLPQWQQAFPNTAAKCITCHTAHTTDGDAKLAWLQKARTVAQCNACHRVAGEGEG